MRIGIIHRFFPGCGVLPGMRLLTGCLVALLVAAQTVHAQIPPDSVLAAAATAPTGGDGRAWVYLAWSAATTRTLQGRSFAVYTHPGAPEVGGTFVQQAVVGQSPPNAAAVAPLIATGTSLGESSSDLAAALDALTAAPEVRAASSPEAKLAAALALAPTQPADAAALGLLAQRFRSVSMALGRAFAFSTTPGPLTIELRDFNPSVGKDRFVVARFSLNAGLPTALPPPGPPLVTPATSSADDLKVRLVWGETDDLRRRSPLLQGFDVWRLPAATARLAGFDGHAPLMADLAAAGAVKINDIAANPRHAYSLADAAAAAGDTANALFTDGGPSPSWKDGDEYAWFVVARDLLGNVGLVSKAGFGFVCSTLPPAIPRGLVAESWVGPSDGGKVRETTRLRWQAIAVPGRVDRYEIYRGTTNLPPVAPTNSPPDSWRVDQIPSNPANQTYEWKDGTLDALADPSLLGQGFWYSVRSVRQTQCGPIASALSPPVFVNLHRLDAPPPPSGTVITSCPRVVIAATTNSYLDDPTLPFDLTVRHVRVIVARRDRGVAWTQVLASSPDGRLDLTSPELRFGEEDDSLSFDFDVPVTGGLVPQVQIAVDAGSFNGAVAPYVVETVRNNSDASVLAVGFSAASLSYADIPGDPLGANETQFIPSTVNGFSTNGTVGLLLEGNWTPSSQFIVVASSRGGTVAFSHSLGLTYTVAPNQLVVTDPLVLSNLAAAESQSYSVYRVISHSDIPDGPCPHIAFPSGSSQINPIRLQLQLPPRSHEWRIYRRLDDGPLTLIARGIADGLPVWMANTVTASDDAMPVAGAHLCYFGQVLDVNGNGSPLSPIGCEDVPPQALPVPLLAAPSPEGDASAPVMRLHWFCPPGGVHQFAVILMPQSGAAPIQGKSLASQAVKWVVRANSTPVRWSGKFALSSTIAKLLVQSEILTGPIGPDPTNLTIGSGPDFSFPVDVTPGVTYQVQVAAVDGRGHFGHASHAHSFTWRPPQAIADRNVPWPQRPLPPVGLINTNIAAELLTGKPVVWPQPTNAYLIGIKLGSMPAPRGVWGPLRIGPAGGLQFWSRLPLDNGIEPFFYTDVLSTPPRPGFIPSGVVLYRQQVANGAFPRVTGTVSQVSPSVGPVLVRKLDNDNGYELLNPFIGVMAHLYTSYDFYLLDTHPAVAGARYHYTLVHFAANGEPDQSIPAGEVELPP